MFFGFDSVHVFWSHYIPTYVGMSSIGMIFSTGFHQENSEVINVHFQILNQLYQDQKGNLIGGQTIHYNNEQKNLHLY